MISQKRNPTLFACAVQSSTCTLNSTYNSPIETSRLHCGQLVPRPIQMVIQHYIIYKTKCDAPICQIQSR